jgi:hypothetical protein
MQQNSTVYETQHYFHVTRSDTLLKSIQDIGLQEKRKVTSEITCWCNNYSKSEFMTKITSPAVLPDEITGLKNLGEFQFSARSLFHVSLAASDNDTFSISFFTSDIKGATEPDTEVRFDISRECYNDLFDFCRTQLQLFFRHIETSRKFSGPGGLFFYLYSSTSLDDDYCTLAARGRDKQESEQRYLDFYSRITHEGLHENDGNTFKQFLESGKGFLHRQQLFKYSIEQLDNHDHNRPY